MSQKMVYTFPLSTLTVGVIDGRTQNVTAVPLLKDTESDPVLLASILRQSWLSSKASMRVSQCQHVSEGFTFLAIGHGKKLKKTFGGTAFFDNRKKSVICSIQTICNFVFILYTQYWCTPILLSICPWGQ